MAKQLPSGLPAGFQIQAPFKTPESTLKLFKHTYKNSDGTFHIESNNCNGIYRFKNPDGTFDFFSDLFQYDFTATMIVDGFTIQGHIYKDFNEPFFIFFSLNPFINPAAGNDPFFHLFFSFNGNIYHRWLTPAGTDRFPLQAVVEGPEEAVVIEEGPIVVGKPDPNPTDDSNDPDFGQPGEVPENTLRFNIGRGKIFNEPRFCFKHGADTRDQFVEVYMEVKHPDIDQIQNEVTECIRISGVAALIAAAVAAYTTGGSAALPAAKATFLATFKPCIKAKLGSIANELKPQIKLDKKNGDWSGH